MPLHIEPLVSNDAVYHRIAHAPISACTMMPDHPVLFGTQGRDRSLRREVEVVRAQPDNLARERVECVFQQQKLATGVMWHVATGRIILTALLGAALLATLYTNTAIALNQYQDIFVTPSGAPAEHGWRVAGRPTRQCVL